MDSTENPQQKVRGLTLTAFSKLRDVEIEKEFNEISADERQFTRFYKDSNMNRSQYDNVPLYDKDAVQLSPISGYNDFVHASKVVTSGGDGGCYLIAQTPLVNPPPPRDDTQFNWYRMLWELNVYVGVCLVNLGHEPGCEYYFHRDKGGVHKVENYEVTTLDVGTDLNWCWAYYRLNVARKEKKKRFERLVQLVVVRNWTDDPRSPLSYRDLADLLHFVWSLEDESKQQRRAQQGAGEKAVLHPTLIHSRAGMNRAGTYVAASIFGRHLTCGRGRTFGLDRVVKVCKSLRSVRYDVLNRRSQFVLLLDTLLEMGVRNGLVTEEDIGPAREVLHKAIEEIHRARAKFPMRSQSNRRN